MNFKAYRIILTRQIKQKFGRFLLASGGIAVGVWAITLTNGLSVGVQNLVQDFVNGQPIAREFQINKLAESSIDFFSASSPSLLPMGTADIEEILKENPQIEYLAPNGQIKVNIAEAGTGAINTCIMKPETQEIERLQINARPPTKPSETCKTIGTVATPLSKLYENNRTSWVGAKPEEFGSNDIVLCYRCGADVFKAFSDIKKPSDLLGKTIDLSIIEAPVRYPLNQTVKFSANSFRDIKSSESNVYVANAKQFTIRAVIDDAETATISINSLGSSSFYVPQRLFDESFALANPNVDASLYGVLSVDGAVKSYDQLEGVVNRLNSKKFVLQNSTEQGSYSTFSLGIVLVQAIPAVFNAINAIFFLFGLVAIIASIFGIINVMAISVLERKKEIGILKALGAPDRSIFGLFVSESAFLGVLGWTIGTLFAVGMGYLITWGTTSILSSFPDIRKNLETFNLTSFSPEFGGGLLLTTFAIALITTVLSGLIPSIRAARQNPAEVMRSE